MSLVAPPKGAPTTNIPANAAAKPAALPHPKAEGKTEAASKCVFETHLPPKLYNEFKAKHLDKPKEKISVTDVLYRPYKDESKGKFIQDCTYTIEPFILNTPAAKYAAGIKWSRWKEPTDDDEPKMIKFFQTILFRNKQLFLESTSAADDKLVNSSGVAEANPKDVLNANDVALATTLFTRRCISAIANPQMTLE